MKLYEAGMVLMSGILFTSASIVAMEGFWESANGPAEDCYVVLRKASAQGLDLAQECPKDSCLAKKDATGRTPLHWAAAEGNLEVVKYLIKHCGLDIDEQEFFGWTPLHLAAMAGKASVVALLLDEEADSSKTDRSGLQALHLALAKRHKFVAWLLARAGALDYDSAVAPSPLVLAAENGYLGLVKYLVSWEGGRDGCPDAVKALLAREVLNAAPARDGSEPDGASQGPAYEWYVVLHSASIQGLNLVQECPKDICLTKKDADDRTPLHWAAQAGDLDVVAYLINHCGLNIDAVEQTLQKTPLHLAAENGKTAIVGFLLDKGASRFIADDDGLALPLHLALKNGCEAIAWLLAQGVDDSDGLDDDGPFFLTPLAFAAQAGYLDFVEYLVVRQAAIEGNSDARQSPVGLAVEENHIEVAEYLLAKGANANGHPENLGGCLIGASSVTALKMLLESGAEVSLLSPHPDSSLGESTVLHWIAQECDDVACIEFLMKQTDADPEICDSKGHTVLESVLNERMKGYVQREQEIKLYKVAQGLLARGAKLPTDLSAYRLTADKQAELSEIAQDRLKLISDELGYDGPGKLPNALVKLVGEFMGFELLSQTQQERPTKRRRLG